MTLIHWQPWQEIDSVRRQMDRLFDDFGPLREAIKLSEPTWTPAIELSSNDTEFVLRVQLPGIDAKDVDVQVGRNAIVLSGEHPSEQQAKENGYLHSEFRYGKFQRVISLPASVQNDQVKADFKDGVLTLFLPRVQAVKPSVVKVNLTGAEINSALPE
ncbi:MAG: Hsp20/alpha crystallin family protein [Leptolyngbyaceae cyanobacterium SU_3_3]|nr:Hsp20/alpha crystallin family protein [Leptolyngbyaceae cyanobacterium SU_3_3]NJR50544.1 Hsp20/alpha crystallin family protein [Leptolyngbyaceae cyanobacterium CSU_1_3]